MITESTEPNVYDSKDKYTVNCRCSNCGHISKIRVPKWLIELKEQKRKERIQNKKYWGRYV